eukprot:jgi/Botrbrau1/14362/Bobra.0014s0017.1
MGLTDMYEAYYSEDPSHRHPPVPTAFLSAPGTFEALTELYYHKMHHTEVLKEISMRRLDVVMKKIWIAFRRIEEILRTSNSRRQLLRSISERSFDPHGEPLAHYILKREHSERPLHIKSVAFPISALRLNSPLSESMFRGSKPWRARPELPERLKEGAAEDMFACWDGSVRPEFCFGDGSEVPYESLPYLQEAAEFVLHNSCGEGFLVQPKITGLPYSEYRVYIFGGASAEGNENDTVVVYTPATVHAGNLSHPSYLSIGLQTLPYGTFKHDLWEPPGLGGSREGLRWPRMHQLIIETALQGAKAIAKYGGQKMKTVAYTYARVDVAMIPLPLDSNVSLYKDVSEYANGRGIDLLDPLLLYYPVINEMDWINSAGVLYKGWERSLPLHPKQQAAAHMTIDTVKTFRGTQLASFLLEEISLAAVESAV